MLLMLLFRAAGTQSCFAWQACEGLPESGVADAATWARLLGDEFPSDQPAVSPALDVSLGPHTVHDMPG